MVPQKEIGRKTHAAGFADGDEGSRSFSGRLFDMAKKNDGRLTPKLGLSV
jgi:hypothetical protein